MPGEAAEGEVGERMAERREFPIENADDLRCRRRDHKVAEPEIAVRDRHGIVARRHVTVEPGCDLVQGRDRAGGGRRRPLASPALDLPAKVMAGPAEVAEPDRLGTNGVERRQRVGHRQDDGAALAGLEPRHSAVVEHAPLEPLHDIERRADQLRVLAIEDHARNRDGRPAEGAEHADLTVDRMRRGQQNSRGPLSQDQPVRAGIETEGRVRLAPRDPLDMHRPGGVGQDLAHGAGQRVEIEPEGLDRVDIARSGCCGQNGGLPVGRHHACRRLTRRSGKRRRASSRSSPFGLSCAGPRVGRVSCRADLAGQVVADEFAEQNAGHSLGFQPVDLGRSVDVLVPHRQHCGMAIAPQAKMTHERIAVEHIGN